MRATLMNLNLALVAAVVAGCNGFGGYPVAPSMGTDAGMPTFAGDGGTELRADSAVPSGEDAGSPAVDSGSAPSEHVLGAACDPDRDVDVDRCQLSWCSESYMVCADGTWQCFAAGYDCHDPSLTDAGHEEPDAGHDAGTTCADGHAELCPIDCGGGVHVSGVHVCMSGVYGACREIRGLGECPATGTDAGPAAMVDGGVDGGVDAGMGPSDAGSTPDAYVAPVDAGSDAYVPPADTRTVRIAFTVLPSMTTSTSTMFLSEEMAVEGATHADARRVTCDAGSGTIVRDSAGVDWFVCNVTRPVDTHFIFVGNFAHAGDGYNWATMSGWNRTTCGDGSATAGVTWNIRDRADRSLLAPTVLPTIIQPRHITEDDPTTPIVDVVCRGDFVFSASLPR